MMVIPQPQLLPMLRMHGTIPSLPHTSLWDDAGLGTGKHTILVQRLYCGSKLYCKDSRAYSCGLLCRVI
jgi:hypothetical protein